jgi:uncharacterized protein YciI
MIPTRALLQSVTKQARKMVEWTAIVYDKPGSSRAAYRDQHLKDIPTSFANGSISSAGALLNALPKEGEKLDFAGSILSVNAESKEEVLEILSKDVYARNGVWDLTNVLIYPTIIAGRKGKDL